MPNPNHTKTNDIQDSPGIQTSKQAILWNEANHEDLITEYNAHDHDTQTITYTNKTMAYASNVFTGFEDGLDGDHLDITYTPTNYTPATTPSEADDVDDLAAHLYGIDQQLEFTNNLTATYAEVNTACDGITATAAEINTACDGVTATAAEINTACDGITATAAEINTVADGVTATAAEVNTVCDGATATAAELNAAADGIGVTIPRQKIVEIGDWNMDSTSSVNVAHGLTYSKIIGLRWIIRDDADTERYPGTDTSVASNSADIVGGVVGANVVLARGTSDFYDSTDYDSTSYNRGWIILDYID